MNERILAATSGSGALVSITIQEINATISMTAGLAAILAAAPVIIDRWSPKLRAWFGRPAAPPPPPPPSQPPAE